MAETGTTVENTDATEDSGNRYNLCQRSGFKAKPGELVRDGYGSMVLPEYAEPRHPQDLIRSRPEHQTGAVRPEQDNVFLSDGEVTADSL